MTNYTQITKQRPGYILIAVLLCVLLMQLLRTAWIGDDAAITLRTVVNLLAGHGASFNIGERVQAYTHPLWFGLIAVATAVTGNVFTATFVLAIATSLAVMYVLLRYVVNSNLSALLVVVVLMLSRAWVDFSASGLEGPMSHFLCLAVFLSSLQVLQQPAASGHKLCVFFLLCSLLYLNRPDLLLMVAPLAVWVCWSWRAQPRKLAKALATGMLPALLWTLFSLFYYGFPFPNTAYAKLGNAIPHLELFHQGILYFLDSLKRDPLTLSIVALGLFFAVRATRTEQALMFGMLLYILWLLSIGGDFMSGRLLTPLLLFALVILVRVILAPKNLMLLCVIAITLGACNIKATLLSGKRYSDPYLSSAGIADERGFYFRQRSLLRGKFFVGQGNDTGTVVACGGVGYRALEAGMKVHFVDSCGLSDPLLARLPSRYDSHWRIGHFYRQLPTGYLASVTTNSNLLADPVTRDYYASIMLVTRAALFDPLRLKEIVRLNFHQVKQPDTDTYRNTLVPVYIGATENHPAAGDAAVSVSARLMSFGQYIDVQLPYPVAVQSIAVNLRGSTSYQASYLSAGEYVPFMDIGLSKPGVDKHSFSGIAKLSSPPVDRIRIAAHDGAVHNLAGNIQINVQP